MSKKLHVLVVEDVEIAQKIAMMILMTLGHSVDIAVNGKTALAMFQEKHYDLIFMDVGLPDIDGLSVTREIRLMEKKSSHIFIVALTANYDDLHKFICLESGMDDFLSKPLTKSKAFDIIETFIEKNHLEYQQNK